MGNSRREGCRQVKDAALGQNAGLLAKLLGLILTVLAVSPGAPFWFDLLSKLANVRGSGAVPTDLKGKGIREDGTKGSRQSSVGCILIRSVSSSFPRSTKRI